MLIQWMLAYPLFTIMFIGACVTWTLMTIDDIKENGNYYKNKNWKKEK